LSTHEAGRILLQQRPKNGSVAIKKTLNVTKKLKKEKKKKLKERVEVVLLNPLLRINAIRILPAKHVLRKRGKIRCFYQKMDFSLKN